MDSPHIARHRDIGGIEQNPDETGVDFGHSGVEDRHDKEDSVED